MMTMVQAAAKDSKARIVNEFQQILAERQTLASRVATREEEAEKEQNRSVLESVAQYTADGIIRGLADLQLEFGTIITGLSTQLTTETAKLDDLKRAIAAESQNLQDLRQTRVVADALYLLTQEHQANLRLLEQRLTSERESLEKEITETRKLWQREQAEFDLSVNDSNELLQRERQRQEADYQYDNERSRKIATDDYEETQRQSERELQATRQAKEKDWTERERTLAANQTLLEEYQRKVATIPTELDEAVKKAREEGIRDANQEAKVKAELLEKEWESTQQGYEFQIQSLEAKVQKQAEQISETTTQLQTALRQAQELAMRAFDSSSNRNNNG
jgi:hypothetical protein